jgi:hypothetical protein
MVIAIFSLHFHHLLFFKIGKSKIFYTVLFLKMKLTSNVIKLVVKNVETKNKKQ